MKTPLRRLVIDVLVWVTMVVPLFIASDPLPASSPLSSTQLRVVGSVVFALALLLGRRVPFVGALLPVMLTTVAAGGLYAEQLVLAQIVLAFLLGRRTGGWSAPAQIVALVAVTLVAQTLTFGGRGWLEGGDSLVLQVVFPWAIGQYLRQQDQLASAGFELARRLEEEQARSASRERAQERTRIAGDMHDSLGHDLALLAVKAGAVQVVPEAPTHVRRAAAELRESAAATTIRLRQIIGVLRADDAPTLPHTDTIRSLVERATDQGMVVTLTEEGEDASVSDAERAAHRVVREALTNAAKHAPGARVDVDVVRTPELLRVRVVNAIGAAGTGDHTAGYGLIGLDERVRLAGGSLEAGAHDETFTVHASLPVAADGHVLPATAPVAHRALTEARQQFRRGMAVTSAVPVVLVVLVLLSLLVRT